MQPIRNHEIEVEAVSIFNDIWLWLNGLFDNKKLAILGERGVGKTTLLSYITTGSFPKEAKQTVSPQKSKRSIFKLGSIRQNISTIWDMPGGKDYYNEWKKQTADADVVLYLFRIDGFKYKDISHILRVKKDLNQIKKWLTKEKRLILIGTYADKDKDFYEAKKSRLGDYYDKFLGTPEMREINKICGGTSNFSVILGSLGSVNEAKNICEEIFKEYKK